MLYLGDLGEILFLKKEAIKKCFQIIYCTSKMYTNIVLNIRVNAINLFYEQK